ncbi:hypothetical protein Lsan_1030 [Legionella santicrucis]|uniref:Uncharacterized protein n=1 Tax=Legionella santicrucis TaxID=45074 RepID=A0A0W0Z3A1_9GAMM|nr:hypothetical protein [Legionella santicrucis]KTD63597.1 hypothetical protein Lsan_1030 [Legionella santicrucis]
MACEKYIKEHQTNFDLMVEAAESMAQDWIAQDFDPWRTSSLYDVRMAKEWDSFLNSKFYDLYNKIILPIKISSLKEPGRAFKLFTAAIEDDLKTDVISFNRDLFILFFNDHLKRTSVIKELAFEYKPTRIHSESASVSNNQPKLNQESKLYKALVAPFTFWSRWGFNNAKSLLAVEEQEPSNTNSKLSN